MAFDPAEQAAIIELMHGKYQSICAIESEWSIRLHEGDMRPRIEHFHDAVRALTSGSASLYEKNSRLAVEQLAYDLARLRDIPQRPVGSINRTTDKSLATALVKQGEAGASYAKLPPASVRADIVTLYRDYTVFFAALFAEVADRNYQSRMDAIDTTVADIGLIEQLIGQLIAGTVSAEQALHEMMHVEHDALRERLQAALANKKLSAREKQQALTMLKTIEQGMAKEKHAIEQAHTRYATGQLAVYEDAKDTVKRLASSGLNLAGKFVESAIQSAQRGKGREV